MSTIQTLIEKAVEEREAEAERIQQELARLRDWSLTTIYERLGEYGRDFVRTSDEPVLNYSLCGGEVSFNSFNVPVRLSHWQEGILTVWLSLVPQGQVARLYLRQDVEQPLSYACPVGGAGDRRFREFLLRLEERYQERLARWREAHAEKRQYQIGELAYRLEFWNADDPAVCSELLDQLTELAPERADEWQELYDQAIVRHEESKRKRAELEANLRRLKRDYLAYKAQRQARAAENSRIIDRMQSILNQPFSVWSLRYPVADECDDEESFYVETVKVLRPKPDAEGYWLTVSPTGATDRWRFRQWIGVGNEVQLWPLHRPTYSPSIDMSNYCPDRRLYYSPHLTRDEAWAQVESLAALLIPLPDRPDSQEYGYPYMMTDAELDKLCEG